MDLDAAAAFAFEIIKNTDTSIYYYHNIIHSMDVYRTIDIYNQEENIGSHSYFLLKTAAAFHDTGITENYQDHEKVSVTIAREALPRFGYKNVDIELIAELILATKIPVNPQNKMERLLCDADLDYLGRDDYFVISEQLRKEWIALGFRNYSIEEWKTFQVKYLNNHLYFSKAARKLRCKGVICNLKQLKKIAE